MKFIKNRDYWFVFKLTGHDRDWESGGKVHNHVMIGAIWGYFSFYIWPIVDYDYKNLCRKEYGICLFNNHFNVMYGSQTEDSINEKRWSTFLPWNEWRFCMYRLYTPQMKLFYEFDDFAHRKRINRLEKDARIESRMQALDKQHEAQKAVDKLCFSFDDFDGERIQAVACIEERTWKRGTNSFRWLSWFVKDKVHLDLDIRFSHQVGPKKGSYKGGILGTSTAIQNGEKPHKAFMRFAEQHNFSNVKLSLPWENAPDPAVK